MDSKIDNLINNVIQKRPQLQNLRTDKPITEYLRPAFEWSRNAEVFPQSELLRDIIVSHVKRLYGDANANLVRNHFEENWMVETGAHLHIPRRYNKASKTSEPQINSLLFQGQVLFGLSQHDLGRQVSVSLNSGRVPLDNTNSGAYLDLPALKSPITLASKKKHPDSPQSLIPGRSTEEVQPKIEQLIMLHRQRVLPTNQYELGLSILKNFLNFTSSFSDQTATTHAMLMDKILPIKQITLDSEIIGMDFLVSLFKNPHSLLYKIFADPNLRTQFIEDFQNIPTGWSTNGSPFYEVEQKNEGFRLVQYTGDLSPSNLVKFLEKRTIWPNGVLKFFSFMAEGGICSTGGWTQAGYCTDIKIRSKSILEKLGFKERANLIGNIPTNIAAVGPCWGLDVVAGKTQLLDAITSLLDPASINFSQITKLSGNQTFLTAAPTLYEFILGTSSPVSYEDLSEKLRFAFVRN